MIHQILLYSVTLFKIASCIILMLKTVDSLPPLLPHRAVWVIRCYYSHFYIYLTHQVKRTTRGWHRCRCCRYKSIWLYMSNTASHLLHLRSHSGLLFLWLQMWFRSWAAKSSCTKCDILAFTVDIWHLDRATKESSKGAFCSAKKKIVNSYIVFTGPQLLLATSNLKIVLPDWFGVPLQ